MRSGYLIVGALIFALAAAGVLVWADVIDLSRLRDDRAPEQQRASAPPKAPESADAKWTRVMNDIVAAGGVAVTFTDKDIPGWGLAQGHQLERFSIEGGQVVFARLSSSVTRNNTLPTWPERGLSYTFPVELSNRTNGARLEIGVIARRPRANGSDSLYVAYATQQAGHSGWQRIGLKSEFHLSSFVYNVPRVSEYTNPPVIVLHADDSATGRSVELVGIYIKPLPPQ